MYSPMGVNGSKPLDLRVPQTDVSSVMGVASSTANVFVGVLSVPGGVLSVGGHKPVGTFFLQTGMSMDKPAPVAMAVLPVSLGFTETDRRLMIDVVPPVVFACVEVVLVGGEPSLGSPHTPQF